MASGAMDFQFIVICWKSKGINLDRGRVPRLLIQFQIRFGHYRNKVQYTQMETQSSIFIQPLISFHLEPIILAGSIFMLLFCVTGSTILQFFDRLLGVAIFPTDMGSICFYSLLAITSKFGLPMAFSFLLFLEKILFVLLIIDGILIQITIRFLQCAYG